MSSAAIVQASGNPAVQTGPATITVTQSSTTTEALLASLLSFCVGAGVVFLVVYSFRKERA
jgi:hypothetical protein